MAKVKHLSDGTNTWDVGGGTEVFTAPGDVWEMKVTIDSTSVSGSTVTVTQSAAEITNPSGTTTPALAPGQALGMQQGDIIHITFTGTLPADTIDTIAISMFYTLNLSQAGAMANEYYSTVTNVGYPGTTLNQIATPAPTVYDRLKVVAPLKVTNDGTDDCLGADFKLPYKVALGSSGGNSGYTQLSIFDENDFQIGITTYFNSLTPIIYGDWSDYDDTDKCFKGISLGNYTEYDLMEDCILVVRSAYEGCQYAKIVFDTALFGNSTVRFCNYAEGTSGTVYFTTTRDMYFRVKFINGTIMLIPIENPSLKYNFIRNATDIDVNGPIADSTATIPQILGAMLAVYGWGQIYEDDRTYVIKDSNDTNINPQTTISLIKDKEYVECQHFTSPVTGIYKLINAGGGNVSIVPIKAVSCSPNTSDADLCSNTSSVFYDNQTTAANRGWKLPQEASWPSDGNIADYCYNFFIFGELQSGA